MLNYQISPSRSTHVTKGDGNYLCVRYVGFSNFSKSCETHLFVIDLGGEFINDLKVIPITIMKKKAVIELICKSEHRFSTQFTRCTLSMSCLKVILKLSKFGVYFKQNNKNVS